MHWDLAGLVVIDEASMMTLEMLAGILHKVSPFAHVVLIGDPNQLLSVGAGNVLTDLLALGVPCTQLTICHRQCAAEALSSTAWAAPRRFSPLSAVPESCLYQV